MIVTDSSRGRPFPELNRQSCNSPCPLSRRGRRPRGPSISSASSAASPPVVIEIDTSPPAPSHPPGREAFVGAALETLGIFLGSPARAPSPRRAPVSFFLDRREGSPRRFSTRTPWATRPPLAWPAAAAATAAADYIYIYIRGAQLVTIEGNVQIREEISRKENN